MVCCFKHHAHTTCAAYTQPSLLLASPLTRHHACNNMADDEPAAKKAKTEGEGGEEQDAAICLPCNPGDDDDGDDEVEEYDDEEAISLGDEDDFEDEDEGDDVVELDDKDDEEDGDPDTEPVNIGDLVYVVLYCVESKTADNGAAPPEASDKEIIVVCSTLEKAEEHAKVYAMEVFELEDESETAEEIEKFNGWISDGFVMDDPHDPEKVARVIVEAHELN